MSQEHEAASTLTTVEQFHIFQMIHEMPFEMMRCSAQYTTLPEEGPSEAILYFDTRIFLAPEFTVSITAEMLEPGLSMITIIRKDSSPKTFIRTQIWPTDSGSVFFHQRLGKQSSEGIVWEDHGVTKLAPRTLFPENRFRAMVETIREHSATGQGEPETG